MAKKKKKVTLEDSVVTSFKAEVGPAEKVRRQNAQTRDRRTNLGKGKPSTVVVK
jgi:hypothetical protein